LGGGRRDWSGGGGGGGGGIVWGLRRVECLGEEKVVLGLRRRRWRRRWGVATADGEPRHRMKKKEDPFDFEKHSVPLHFFF
jgi:hypothetical protein